MTRYFKGSLRNCEDSSFKMATFLYFGISIALVQGLSKGEINKDIKNFNAPENSDEFKYSINLEKNSNLSNHSKT